MIIINKPTVVFYSKKKKIHTWLIRSQETVNVKFQSDRLHQALSHFLLSSSWGESRDTIMLLCNSH